MENLNEILNLITLALLALGGYILAGTKKFFTTSFKKFAEEVTTQITWSSELDRKLQETRGIERQEFRFKSYGKLWNKLKPLAIFKNNEIDKNTVIDLNSELTEWYFSECGGLLLTRQAREFYFALQDLLKTTSKTPKKWHTTRIEKPEEVFYALVEKRNISDALDVLNYFKEREFLSWPKEAEKLGNKWKTGIEEIAESWNELDESERFASLQQVGSILRTSLTIDLESRLL